MKFDSIKLQFLIFLSVCMAGMITLVATQHYFTNRLIQLNQQSNQLTHLSNNLLQMRRDEKDFLLRANIQYVESFKALAKRINEDIQLLQPLLLEYQLNQQELNDISNSFNSYVDQFLAVVELDKKIGLDENSGQQWQFRDAAHQLEQAFSESDLANLQVLLLQMRRFEKDFMARHETSYVVRQARNYQTLVDEVTRLNLTNQDKIPKLLDQYQSSFLTLVSYYTERGLKHHQGLQGQYREQSHIVEQQVNAIRDKLKPLIADEEEKVLSNSFLILILTSALLILIIIRTFTSFQRAFSTFVMFFHRAKRELTPLDTKNVVFSEFKGLANVANEMVEARREMDVKLRAAMDKLEQLNNTLEIRVDDGLKEISQLNDEITSTQKEVVYTMGAISETRSKETGQHVRRVAEYSKLLGLKVGLDEAEADLLKQASPMHDIGKVAIPDSILLKKGALTAEERKIMESHAELGYEMLCHSDRPILKAAAIVALEHHEKWDGTGYPRGLEGEEIHIYGRITMLADVFDALGSARCYKNAWKDDEIFTFIEHQKGRMFDPNLVEIFFENIEAFFAIREKYKDKVDEAAA